jgi:hypothetical protein
MPDEMMSDGAELPRYRSHKEVWALKIAAIEFDKGKDGGATITPAEPGYVAFKVDHNYVYRHEPKVGGYYVVYADGYKSWSPAEAFEDGYVRI